METQAKQYKRQDRSVSPETREKISNSLRGRSKSLTHCQNIAQGVKNYWEQIPKQKEDNETITMDDTVL